MYWVSGVLDQWCIGSVVYWVSDVLGQWWDYIRCGNNYNYCINFIIIIIR